MAGRSVLFGHFPALNADVGSCRQENGAKLVLVAIPDHVEQAGTRQRCAMKYMHGDRSRAVWIYREGPLDRFLDQVPSDAGGLSASECPSFGKRRMTYAGEWTDRRIDDRACRGVAVSSGGIRYGALMRLRLPAPAHS